MRRIFAILAVFSLLFLAGCGGQFYLTSPYDPATDPHKQTFDRFDTNDQVIGAGIGWRW